MKVTRNGTRMVSTVPLNTAIIAYSVPVNFVITGRVVSIEVAPPAAIGASLPKYLTNSGAMSNVATSLMIFDSNATTPGTLPAILLIKILDKL